MKTVFSKADDVFHVFAQQTQTDAKNTSRNVFTRRSNYDLNYADEIYSYGHHYLLGKFIDKDAILINDRGYSVTTSKHISGIRYATRQYRQFYTTKTDLDLVHGQIKYLFNKWAKARKPILYSSEINNLFNSLNEYIDYRKLKIKRNPKYTEIKKIHKAVNNNDTQALEKYRKNKAAREKAALKKKLNKALEKFYNYEIYTVRLGQNKDYLRLSKCGKYVETTQGVKVSLKSAKLLYLMIKQGKDIKGHKIDNYTVISINGALKIGFHNIDTNSVKKIGEQIIKL